jgi:hypothetical protein
MFWQPVKGEDTGQDGGYLGKRLKKRLGASQMSKGPSDFKLTNVKRAFTAAKMAGVDVARVEVATNGTISIIPKGAKEKPAAGKPGDGSREIVL